MLRFLGNCSQNKNLTALSGNDGSTSKLNTEKSNITITNRVSDRTFQGNVIRPGASEQTYVASEAPSRGQFPESQNVFKVPTDLPPRRETSVYSTAGSAVSSRVTIQQPPREDLNINELRILWNDMFLTIEHTMPLMRANDLVRSMQNLLVTAMWYKTHNSTRANSHTTDVQEWLSTNSVSGLQILPSQVTQPNCAAPVSSSQLDDIQFNTGPGKLSIIDDVCTEDETDSIFNNFSRSRLRNKSLLGRSADTTTEKIVDHSNIIKTNTVQKSVETNESVQRTLRDVTKKITDKSATKNRTVAKNCNKLQKASKCEEKTGRARKQKEITANEVLNENDRSISSRGRKITPSLKYWEGEKLSQTYIKTASVISISEHSKSKKTDDSPKLNESMTLRSHKQLNVNGKLGSAESNKSIKDRTKKLNNKQEYFSNVDAQEGRDEKVSKCCNGKSSKCESVSYENKPQVKESNKSKGKKKITESEEKENKSENDQTVRKTERKNPQKQKSNETEKTSRKRKVNTSAEVPSKKTKTSSEQGKPEIQGDLFNVSVSLFGYSTKTRLSDSFAQATPGAALNSIRKKAQGAGPLSKETPPSKHLASVMNNSDIDQSKECEMGADKVNKKNYVNQRVANKMTKGASVVTQGKPRKQRQQVKSATQFDDKTAIVLNDVIRGHKVGERTPKNIQTIFRTHLKESHKNKLSENSDSDYSLSDSDNYDLY